LPIEFFMTKPVWSTTQIINQLDSGMVWSGSSLTYGFATTASWFTGTEGNTFTALGAAQKTAATQAIGLWDDLIAPSFSLAANGNTANVRYANSQGVSFAQTYYPGNYADAGTVWFNPNYDASSGTNDLVTPTVGQWGFLTYLHETGHSLGLNHPGTYNGGSPTYAANALYQQDSLMYTVMSYFDGSNTGADWIASDGHEYFPQTPMMHDVLSIQTMYGADTTTRSGDTVYGFNSTANRDVFDFTKNPHPVLCIYDAGGNDTLDLSGFASSSTIDLTPGSFSNCDMMTKNVSIALNTYVENAVGGVCNDQITGNTHANILTGNGGDDVLKGGAGDDTLYGGTGNDTAVFSDVFADYAILAGPTSDSVVLSDLGGSDGTDTVFGTELFAFLDTTLSFASLLAFLGTPPTTPVTMMGTSGNNVLMGGSASDTLTGLAGNDRLDGGAGADLMIGGAGNDVYVVDDPGDVVDESHGTGSDLVQSSISFSLADATHVKGTVEQLTLTGTADIDAVGNKVANLLTGNSGNNDLDGGAGADTMIGGDGNDVYHVDSARDIVQESAGQGHDLVMSNVSFGLSGGAAGVEDLTLTGTRAASATGNGLDNVLTGNAAANTLSGLDGNDTLIGGGGADCLVGGTGADHFVFTAPEARRIDTVKDFAHGSDVLDVVASGFGGNLTAGATPVLLDTNNHLSATHAGSDGYFLFEHKTATYGTLYWDPTGGSATDAVAVAKLAGISTLAVTDLHII
jgi:serralysin